MFIEFFRNNQKNISTTTYNLVGLNKKARIARHKRIFEERGIFAKMSSSVKIFLSDVSSILRPRRLQPELIAINQYSLPVDSMPLGTKKAMFRNILIIGVLLLGFTGFSGTSGIEDISMDTSQYGADSFVMDQDGYFTKTTSVAIEAPKRTAEITHIIGGNETISEIAALYGLKTQTLLWENDVNPLKIRSGDKVLIPPFDGVGYTVKKGDTVAKIASTYKVKAEDILSKNEITAIKAGDKIYIPDAKPIVNASPRNIATRSSGANVVRTPLSGTGAKPAVGKIFIYPTMGAITQGYLKSHHALDIANSNKPPIWAAADGVVIKASSGTWGGGYGNHVIVDHGNGMKTLYAHMEYLEVKVGDQVKQGQVIGKMGRTGRVRGATGIHLHFEVIDNGVKKLPSLYW